MGASRVSASALAVLLLLLVCAGSGSLPAEGAATSARASSPARATLWAEIDRRCGSLAAESLPPYPWPLAPFHRQHPVRGYFGDPRTVITGIGEGAFSFHNGIDISAWPGNHVFPVASGLVIKVTPDRVVVASAYDRRFQYIHIHPVVRVGSRVSASESVLGTVDPVFHHVHLSEIRGDCVVNPLMPGHITPFQDHTRPVVAAILFENIAGRRLSPLSLTGKVRVIADAFDRPALPSPPPWNSMPVSPALITWKLTTLHGRVLEHEVAVDFRTSIPPRHSFCQVYAPGTSQNFAASLGRFHWGKPGRYLYDLTPNLLNTALLRGGRYRFVVTAADSDGNTGSMSVSVALARRALVSAPEPVPDTRCDST